VTEYIKISIETEDQQERDIMVALLSIEGYEGFEESDKSLEAIIVASEFDSRAINSLLQSRGLSFKQELIPEQNWNKLWESNFLPISIENFVGIRADFHDPISNVQHEIIINPKMSFGTGHHATTKLMIEQMAGIDFINKSVLDFGTGTGILAIIAERLGATMIDAVDNDEWSIQNAQENIERNGSNFITIVNAEEFKPNHQYDLILANINRQVILEFLKAWMDWLKPGGILLLSGLLDTDESDLRFFSSKFPLDLVKKIQENNWICLRFNH
jgi:ribosomal protein L11 methyltransferase